MRLQRLLAACGGFLLAVLWFDLMFDVQVLGHPVAPAVLPDATLASIAGYYARVTTGAHPMQRLVGLVMVVMVLGSFVGACSAPRQLGSWLAFGAAIALVALAATRVLPNAVQLGMASGGAAEQSALARAIFVDHVVCWLVIAAFTAIQIVGLAPARRSAAPD
jgi:hypothetical protein